MMRQLGQIADLVVTKLRRQILGTRLHALGPRAVVESLEEVIEAIPPIFRGEIEAILEKYGALDPGIVKAVGGDRLVQPPLHLVKGHRGRGDQRR